jgi:hypothetical protein
MKEVGMIRFAMAETLLEARRLAREAVRQRLKEEGRKLQEFSFKELCETADEYLRLRPELIDLACSNLSSDARKSKPSNQRAFGVQMSGSKWRAR